MTFGLSHLALGGALLACAAGLGGYVHGIGVGEAREQAAQKRVDDARETERRKLQAQIDAATEVAQAAEYTRQDQVREITRETQKVIERPVYRNLCVDADGVRLLDRAAAVANGADPRQSADPAGKPAARPAD